ncbi:MAG TPA: hypothetical protein ENH59_08070 [Bacteroidetes bacterium]|nr:hypothetical protein [Bacteroidota bacterium]
MDTLKPWASTVSIKGNIIPAVLESTDSYNKWTGGNTEEILDMNVIMTIVEGRIVYEKKQRRKILRLCFFQCA